jgi:O-antigen/teichoic acid export membrane protein
VVGKWGRQLALPGGAALLSRGGQTLLALVLARTLGVEGYGLFVFALGAAVLTGTFAAFGWSDVVNREMPRLIRHESWGLLRGLNRAADATAISLALAFAAGLLVAAPYFETLGPGLRMAALLAVPVTLLMLRQKQLVAVDHPTLGMMLDQGMAATLVLLVVLIHPLDAEASLAAYGAAGLLLVGIGTVVFRRSLPVATYSARSEYRVSKWLSSGAAMFSSMLPRILVTRLDVLLVAPLAGLLQAGLFGSAFRISLLMTFPQLILQAVVTPRFSRAFAANDLAQVRKLFLLSAAFAFVTCFPLLLPALFIPDLVMATLFGPDFAAGGRGLFWLGIGQFVAAFGVSLNTMIAMGGNHGAMGRQGLAVMLLTLAAGFLVIPQYGAGGAGAVLAGSSILWVAGMMWLARPILSARADVGRPAPIDENR